MIQYDHKGSGASWPCRLFIGASDHHSIAMVFGFASLEVTWPPQRFAFG